MKNNTRKLTCLALTVSFAMVLSYIESRIPAFVAIPGIKVGLANIAVIFTLYKLGVKEAATVSVVRVLLISMLFGNPVSLIYSLTGAAFSFVAMLLLKRFTPLGEVAVSVCGGVLHNIGQTLMAWLLLDTAAVAYYLPFLVLSGTVSGIAIGIAAGIMIGRVDIGKVR